MKFLIYAECRYEIASMTSGANSTHEARRPKAEDRLDLWPPGHFELRFFASRIGRLEIEF